MEIDLREYIQRSGEWDWINDEIRRLGGEKEFYAMRNDMWKALMLIPVGMYFDIEKRVKEENRALFVKIACEVMSFEQFNNYRFNRLCNKVHNDYKTNFKKK